LRFVLIGDGFMRARVGSAHGLNASKENNNKTVYYRPGDDLSFYLKGKKSKIKDEIIGFEDSLIIFKKHRVHVREIAALHIDHKTRYWLRYKPAQILLLGGTAYLLADVLNSGELDKNTLILSGSMIGAGLVAKLIITNKIKVRRNTKLRIVHY
jgi:hypothetical protein